MVVIGQLAFFADGHEAGVQFRGGGGGENESARVNAHHGVHAAGREFFGEQVNRAGEQPRVGEHGRDVLELDARLRKIRDVADGVFDFGGGDGRAWFKVPWVWFSPVFRSSCGACAARGFGSGGRVRA